MGVKGNEMKRRIHNLQTSDIQLLIRGEHDTGKCDFCKEKETVEHDEDMSQIL